MSPKNLHPFFLTKFSYEVWESKYKIGEESFEGWLERISNALARNEKDRTLIKDMILKHRISFGGRIFANAGSNLATTLFNCFILPPEPPDVDSLAHIFKFAHRVAEILKSEGGVGFHLNWIRPRGTIIRGVGITHPGVIDYFEMIDKVAETIVNSAPVKKPFQGKIKKVAPRKGAMMGILSVYHPDILDFIKAKQTPGKLTHYNLSVFIPDAFMEAVKKDRDWDLIYPDINFHRYKDEWNGDFELWLKKGYPVVHYGTIRARELWRMLLKSAYDYAEPNLLFQGLIEKYNNLFYIPTLRTHATNPCGEVFSPEGKVGEDTIGGICCLGSLVLPFYYDFDKKTFDWKGLEEATRLLVRTLDKTYDITYYPVPEIFEKTAKLKRELGIGIMGLGSLLALMNIRYGSEESLKIVEKIFSVIVNSAYSESARLAKKYGPFELYSEKMLENGFIKNSGVLKEEVLEEIKKYGLRNSSLMAVAPTGNTSIFMGGVSNGIEPIFLKEYTRWVKIDGAALNEEEKKIVEMFESGKVPSGWIKDLDGMGGVFYISPDGKYRWTEHNKLQKAELVEDYAWRILKQKLSKEELKNWNIQTTFELDVEDHLKILSVAHKYVDKAISKTINIPHNYPFEKFVEMYEKAYDMGIKGVTVYREGTRLGILVKKEEEEKRDHEYICEIYSKNPEGKVIPDGVRVPTEYPARGYVLRAEGKKWYIHVAFKDKKETRLFHIFIRPSHRYREVSIKEYGVIDKLLELAVKSGINKKIVNIHKEKIKNDAIHDQFARTLSFLMRHNVHIREIVKVLEEVPAPVTSLVAVIRRFLYKFAYKEGEKIQDETCPVCGSNLIFEEGCKRCPACGWTKCS
ncbi:adenosylcobalamin-dependent ribonucleoside-diphosphate reductase [Candidatus Pacearchaeota archaeon]|nr:MAG: adenosylcobalamin-dependent ribonucleoside-diphosphate reductase [Candidatus Pacearchaeota archaeon]